MVILTKINILFWPVTGSSFFFGNLEVFGGHMKRGGRPTTDHSSYASKKTPTNVPKENEEPLITRFNGGNGAFPAEILAFFLNHPTPSTHLDTPQELK